MMNCNLKKTHLRSLLNYGLGVCEKIKTINYMLMLLLLCNKNALAQYKNPLIKKYSEANQSKEMAYDYIVVLRDMTKGKNIDSVKGSLLAINSQYIDSNNFQLNARIGKYYCNLDFKNKTATINQIDDIAKKAGIKYLEDEKMELLNINDTMMDMMENYSIDSSSSKYYRLKTNLKNSSISYFQVDFRKDNYKAINYYFETTEKSQSEYYVTKYYISNIKTTVDKSTFNLSRFFTLANNKAVINPKYHSYKLTPIE